MCRYLEHPVKSHWVCLDCRHVAKSTLVTQNQSETITGQPRCPSCRGDLIDFGPDFKAPSKTSDNQWRKLAILNELGLLFHSCGCDGPGLRPRTLADAKRFQRDLQRAAATRSLVGRSAKSRW